MSIDAARWIPPRPPRPLPPALPALPGLTAEVSDALRSYVIDRQWDRGHRSIDDMHTDLARILTGQPTREEEADQ
jgi:hypothetical protein